MTFGKVVAMAAEIEDAAKAAKLTTVQCMYGDEAMDTTMPVYKVNLAKTALKQESGETVLGKSTSGFKKGTCPLCGKKGHILSKIAGTLRPRAINVGKQDIWNPCALKRRRAG